MTKRILIAAIAACTLALIAGPAQASGGDRTTLVFDLKPDFVTPVSCPGPLGGFKLDVASLDGAPLGTAKTCIKSIDGCDPFAPYCLLTVRATLTLDLERGSLTVPLRVLEIQPTDSSFIQIGTGKVSRGTGAYRHAEGRVAGGGSAAFDNEGTFTGRLVYTAHLRGVR